MSNTEFARHAVAPMCPTHTPIAAGARMTPTAAASAWHSSLEEHLLQHVRQADPLAVTRFTMHEPATFEGVASSGCIGGLRYTRLRMSAATYEQRCSANAIEWHHTVVVQVSGGTRIRAGRSAARTAPGDFVMLNDLSQLSFEHNRAVEVILLHDALPDHLRQQFDGETLVHRPARSSLAMLTLRWIQDACNPLVMQSSQAMDYLAATLRKLIEEVFCEAEPTPAKVDRTAIEAQVACRLQDPELTIADLADSFCCSVRTLHRTFRRGGDDSLERYIQRQRIEACANMLRTMCGLSGIASLTELAMQFGFASQAHFSTAFRAHFGMSPSAYRQMHAG